MVITQAQWDTYYQQAIDAYAARQGAKSITFADQSVSFDSWEEIWSWLRSMQAFIAGRPRTRLAATSKGA